MMMDAVIGCDAVDAGSDWLRLTTPLGAVRTLPWTAVKLAGLGGNHEGHLTIQGVTERVAPFFATHDSLWLLGEGGEFAQIMLEKQHPKRDAILAAFAQHLGPKWRGDALSMEELRGSLFRTPSSIKMPGMIILVMIVLGLTVLAAMLSMLFSHSAR